MIHKQVMPKSEGLSRSLEINAIWTFDTEFPTIFNKSCTYITFKSAVKHRQLGYGYPRGQIVHIAEATTQEPCRCSEGFLLRRFIVPKVRWSEGSLVRRFVSPNLGTYFPKKNTGGGLHAGASVACTNSDRYGNSRSYNFCHCFNYH